MNRASFFFVVAVTLFWFSAMPLASAQGRAPRSQTTTKKSEQPGAAIKIVDRSLWRRGSFGGALGVVAPSMKALSMRMNMGARLGYLATSHVEIGIFYFSSSESIAGSIQSSLDLVGFSSHYVFRRGLLKGLYGGLGLGPAFLSDTLPPALNQLDFGGNYTRMFMGPEIGYDYLIASILSIGFEGAYHFILGPRPFQTPQILVSFKYRFGSKI